MTINYPNGNSFSELNFNHRKGQHTSRINYGDRGMSLEDEINQSNQYYLDEGIAVVHKKPTPIQLVKVDYPNRSAAVIREAYFKQASTTDYNGVFNGKYIDFDAKETKSPTSFPLSNFHEHQIRHMEQCDNQGGITFALIKLVQTNQLFVLNGPDLFSFWDRKERGGRKSISKKEIEEKAYQIHYQFRPLIPYLDAVKKIIDNG